MISKEKSPKNGGKSELIIKTSIIVHKKINKTKTKRILKNASNVKGS
jgi:hypothetical protein